MLYFSGKNAKAYEVIKALQTKPFKKYSLKDSKWWKWVRLILQTISSILISIATEAINAIIPGLGTALDFAFNTLIDLAFNLIENDGKIDWIDFAINTGFNAAGAVVKGFKQFKALRSHNMMLSLADNISDTNKAFKKQFQQSAKQLAKFGAEDLDNAMIANYKTFKKTSTNLLNTLEKTQRDFSLINQNDIFKETAIASKTAYNSTKKVLTKTTNALVKARAFITLLSSPRYAAKKAIDLVLKKPRNKLVKTFNKFISDKVKKVILRGKRTFDDAIKRIPLNSQWIESIGIYKGHSPWDLTKISAVIRFRPLATKSKKPILLWQKDSKLISNFLTTASPGKYYLDNFAWGWDVGKILRKYSSFIALSKIPLLSNLIGTLAHSYKTTIGISRSIKKDKWLWNQSWEDIKKDFVEGLRDGATKGWKFKYIQPATSFIRSAIEKQPTYAIRGMQVLTRKSIYYNKLKPIRNYQYSKSKGGRIGRMKKIKS
ncbi:hypothetical protein [Metamycoplasma hyosynoviae]|uniref:hypothetical protein n=1 Tax=Metamycoplasma hyosynoviae TaxID=29559 RepID=UPI002358DFA7|nr:hypothetical protein [Metamycoplasma hyosynoviae]MDC8919692.1 hypothetical protein [Metamycoplasma hyosynoviae]MDC8962287.1 hypothetical protein [Metamycoplasma hyosynoviae]MDD7912404.1 hypothetical protein [Metamycoplasma hyosynoviae]